MVPAIISVTVAAKTLKDFVIKLRSKSQNLGKKNKEIKTLVWICPPFKTHSTYQWIGIKHKRLTNSNSNNKRSCLWKN